VAGPGSTTPPPRGRRTPGQAWPGSGAVRLALGGPGRRGTGTDGPDSRSGGFRPDLQPGGAPRPPGRRGPGEPDGRSRQQGAGPGHLRSEASLADAGLRVVMRGALAAMSLALVGCASRVMHGLDERQANEIQSVLIERGFGARKVLDDGRPPTWAVEVPTADAAAAIRVLATLGLPRPRPAGVKELLRPGLVPDPLEQHVLLLEAQSGELARTLEDVDGVLSARVHLVRATLSRGGAPARPPQPPRYLPAP